jgi:hypothetical protein
MIEVPYDAKREYDAGFEFIINTVRKTMIEKDDDFLLLNCGFRGTGKSTLTLFAEDAYLGEEASVDYIGLNHHDFATALKKASEKSLPRFCANDEANISKRDHAKTYNKDLLDVYYSIRGKQIFHIWNNPSLDIIDKKFIEDVIKGVILIVSKDKKKPRLYYYFRKVDVMRIWDKYESLSIRLLKRVAREQAYYRGWFKDYKGKLLEPYKKKKDNRMDEKIDTFFDKYGEEQGEYLKSVDLQKMLMVSKNFIPTLEQQLRDKNMLEEKDIKLTVSGRKYYHSSIIEKFKLLKGISHENK